MNVTLTYADPDTLTDTLLKDKDWRNRVFGRNTVQGHNVTAFFLQLIANDILSFAIEKKEPKVVLRRDDKGDYKYESIVNWEGFTFRHRARGSHHSFEEMLRYPTYQSLKVGRNQVRYSNATLRRKEAADGESTSAEDAYLASPNASARKQTHMEYFFSRLEDESKDDEDDNDEDDSTDDE